MTPERINVINKYIKRLHNLNVSYNELDSPSPWLALCIEREYRNLITYTDGKEMQFVEDYYEANQPDNEIDEAASRMLKVYVMTRKPKSVE